MAVDDFRYLEGIFGYVTALYLVVLAVFLVLRRHAIFSKYGSGEHATITYDIRTTFESVVESWIPGITFKTVLLVFRIFSFLYTFIVGLVLYGSEYSGFLFYFHNWNTVAVCAFFLIASIASCMENYAYHTRSVLDREFGTQSEWTVGPLWLSIFAHTLYEVASGCCLLALGIKELFDDIDISFQESHFRSVVYVCVALMGIEMLLNNMRFRFDQYPTALAWTLLYVQVVWPVVFTGYFRNWPHTFLETNRVVCFVNYSLLFCSSFVCYFIWYIGSETFIYVRLSVVQMFRKLSRPMRLQQAANRANAFRANPYYDSTLYEDDHDGENEDGETDAIDQTNQSPTTRSGRVRSPRKQGSVSEATHVVNTDTRSSDIPKRRGRQRQ